MIRAENYKNRTTWNFLDPRNGAVKKRYLIKIISLDLAHLKEEQQQRFQAKLEQSKKVLVRLTETTSKTTKLLLRTSRQTTRSTRK